MTTPTASRIRLLAGTTLALVLFAGCTASPTAAPATTSPAPMSPATTPAMTTPPTATPTPAATSASAAVLNLRLAETSLGMILVDGAGMTLYMFTRDSADTSACEGQCLVAWPPLIGEPTAGEGVDDTKLGSFTRADGRTQATYNEWPLYYWMNDAAPGDTTGQDVQGVWYVLDGDGEPVR